MNTEKDHIKLIYELKEGTSSSYYLKEGPTGILPNRMSIGKDLSPVKQTLKTVKSIGMIKASYNKQETGIYKNLNQGEITSSIFPDQNHQDFTGYFILDERHKIFDLWIINSTDNGLTYRMDYFPGLALNKSDIDNCFYLLQKEKASL